MYVCVVQCACVTYNVHVLRTMYTSQVQCACITYIVRARRRSMYVVQVYSKIFFFQCRKISWKAQKIWKIILKTCNGLQSSVSMRKAHLKNNKAGKLDKMWKTVRKMKTFLKENENFSKASWHNPTFKPPYPCHAGVTQVSDPPPPCCVT